MATTGTQVYFPEMALTLVRRVTGRLPYNHFLFRVRPKFTKLEIKEYLEKVYGVKVARIATSIQLGKTRRAPGRRSTYKLKDFKRVMVTVSDAATKVKAPEAAMQ